MDMISIFRAFAVVATVIVGFVGTAESVAHSFDVGKREREPVIFSGRDNGALIVQVDERYEYIRDEQVEAEAKRLREEIEMVRNHAVGVSYTQGMKTARIQRLNILLDLLESDKYKYFDLKQEGKLEDHVDAETSDQSR